MKKIEEVFAMVEKIAATRSRYSNPNFLPDQVQELAVLTLLESESLSGDLIIRRLTPLNRYAQAFGVSYKLLHDLEGAEILETGVDKITHRRTYFLSDKGQVRLQELRTVYALASEKEWQVEFNFNLVNVLKPQSAFNQQVA